MQNQPQHNDPSDGSQAGSSATGPYNLSLTVFPVPGARPSGVYNGVPPATIPSSGMQQQQQQQTPQSHMNAEDIERHQRSANGGGPLDVYRSGKKKNHNHPLVPFAAPTGSEHNATAYTPPTYSNPQPQPAPAQISLSETDPISSFLAEMPTQSEDPTRHVLWTELIRLKTRSLELQIAEARRKEKEAEVELERLKAGAAARSDNAEAGPSRSSRSSNAGLSGNDVTHPPVQPSSQHVQPSMDPYASLQMPPQAFNSMSMQPTQHLAPPQEIDHMQNLFGVGQHALSPFDLEAMLQGDNLDNMLSWLPDLGDIPGQSMTSASTMDSSVSIAAPTTIVPSALSNTLMPFSSDPMLGTTDPRTQPFAQYIEPMMDPTHSSPIKRHSHSPDPDEGTQPPAKKTKKGSEKKTVIEKSANCTICSKPLARIMIRAPKSQIPNPVSVEIKCLGCRVIDQPSTLPDSSSSTSIGTVETRKRLRASLEIDDEEAKLAERRIWCDVCQRIVGSGQIVGGKERESVTGMTEIVCIACDSKYQRCTDCGGGGGPRVGIGKWRMKQVFHPGRKTCSLSHTRLGDRTRELGVHVTPTDFTPEQLKEVLTRCKALWNEKTLSRLAVPEMLEIDLPANLSNPLRDFADVDDIVTRNWPSREAMIRADGIDSGRFRRLLGLIWAHSKPRRSVKTVDLEEEWTKQAEENDDSDLSTVLANVKRTNVVIPPGSELIGMWGGEWNMLNGSLLISTFIPFEGADGEDSTALSVGEMITRVQSLQQEINAERLDHAEQHGIEAKLLPPCEHLWTVSGGYIPLVRERFADILIRKRAFVHVEEYLTRHPDFIESIRARPVGLHPDIHRPLPLTQNDEREEEGKSQPRPLILVRWLGKEFDAQKILEIKQVEFGGKKKRSKSRV